MWMFNVLGLALVLGLGERSFGLSWLLGVWDNLFVPCVWMLANGRMITSVWLFVCCGCSVLFENCIVDASIFFL